MKLRALAFDLDGTLIDSKIDFQAMREELGLLHDEPVLEAIATWPANKQQWGFDIVHRHETLGAQNSTAVVGAKSFIELARSHNIPCAVFTRNSRQTALWSLELHQIPFDLLLSRDDAKPKPDPDGLWQIASHFELNVNELLFVGDYLYDLQAGLRAGTPTAIYAPIAPEFDTKDAHFIFESYMTLQAWFFANSDKNLVVQK